jgi:DNA repair protein RecO (recombination protein O)
LLPDREANDAIFRLAVSVLYQLRSGPIWMPLTYFQLWLVRLIGFLPELGECMACGTALNGSKAYYHALADGLMCVQHKRLASSQLAPESRTLAAQMFRAPVESFADDTEVVSAAASGIESSAGAGRHADLRKFLVQIMERHMEKKLITAGMLSKL